ncbi:MAG TPA: cyclic-di-AMP receptor [Candidatus Dormibacteraeota bacterium]|nr:cyclic-di-AMP receptor [Candidatus Dormibacteraeota bacterium]
MKLVVAVVHGDDALRCSDALSEAGFAVTRFATSGGFLQKKNATLLAGVDAARVSEVVAILRRTARRRVEEINPAPTGAEAVEFIVPFPVEVEVGGATIFVLDVERFEKV